jgi:hypothetical protein
MSRGSVGASTSAERTAPATRFGTLLFIPISSAMPCLGQAIVVRDHRPAFQCPIAGCYGGRLRGSLTVASWAEAAQIGWTAVPASTDVTTYPGFDVGCNGRRLTTLCGPSAMSANASSRGRLASTSRARCHNGASVPGGSDRRCGCWTCPQHERRFHRWNSL